MSLPLRILLGLAPQLVLIGVVVVAVVSTYHGQDSREVVVGCVVVGVLAVVGLCVVQDRFFFGWPAALLMLFATLAMVVCALYGVNDRLLYERGREADCQVTSVTKMDHGDTTFDYLYGVTCRGGGPTSFREAPPPLEPRPVGSHVALRYDPAQPSRVNTDLGAGDGQIPFVLAGIAAAVLLLAGLAAAVFD